MTKLSEATWAVIAAYGDAPFCGRPAIAAVFRAAADQVAPDDYKCYTGNLEWDAGMEARTDDIRKNLLAIADELENIND